MAFPVPADASLYELVEKQVKSMYAARETIYRGLYTYRLSLSLPVYIYVCNPSSHSFASSGVCPYIVASMIQNYRFIESSLKATFVAIAHRLPKSHSTEILRVSDSKLSNGVLGSNSKPQRKSSSLSLSHLATDDSSSSNTGYSTR